MDGFSYEILKRKTSPTNLVPIALKIKHFYFKIVFKNCLKVQVFVKKSSNQLYVANKYQNIECGVRKPEHSSHVAKEL